MISRKKDKFKKYFISVVAIWITFCIIMSNNILASNYMYDLNNNKEAESSISTVATPEFTFQSQAQILMEATTGKILYANNENEKLLPASVTKVMIY